MLQKLLIVFAAGCVGALANSLALWALGAHGITAMAHVALAPSFTPEWLYPRIVWGGIWGVLFVLPVWSARPVSQGLLMSVFPTLVQCFVVFPFKLHKGYGGVELGTLTPLFVVAVNAVWGVVTAFTIRLAR